MYFKNTLEASYQETPFHAEKLPLSDFLVYNYLLNFVREQREASRAAGEPWLLNADDTIGFCRLVYPISRSIIISAIN